MVRGGTGAQWHAHDDGGFWCWLVVGFSPRWTGYDGRDARGGGAEDTAPEFAQGKRTPPPHGIRWS